jgi:hypothetical protein
MKYVIKYFYFLFFLAAVNLSFASGSDDKYAFKYLETKSYNTKTDLWAYQVFKNDEAFKVLNVYVTDNINGAKILVDVSYSNSFNKYTYYSNKNFDNFIDSYRADRTTVKSIQEAVNLAVDHYIADQIANK